jgi:hypothetical protein
MTNPKIREYARAMDAKAEVLNAEYPLIHAENAGRQWGCVVWLAGNYVASAEDACNGYLSWVEANAAGVFRNAPGMRAAMKAAYMQGVARAVTAFCGHKGEA